MKKFLALAMALIFVGSAQLAMAKGGGGKGAHVLSPKKRLKVQHARIKEGVKNGTISKDEATKLREEGKEINQERKADLKKDGGKLTKEDRKTLENKLDDRSKEIYQDKHNGADSSSTSTSNNSGSVK